MSTDKHIAVLIVAHGSRRAQSNEEIKQLAARVRERAGERFQQVTCAFLELAEPSIAAGIDACVQQGAQEIIVMPYFLSAGRHVVTDVPAAVRAKQADYPTVKMRLSAYLGASRIMPDLILDAVQADQCLCGKPQAECQYPACL